MTRFLLTLLLGLVLGAGGMWYLLEGPRGAHAAVGRWSGPMVSLRLAEDGTGSLTGFALSWRAVDDDTVELRYTDDGDDLVVAFELTGPDKGTLRLTPLAMNLQRVVEADGA